jgi:hypothetical protein
MKIISFVQSFLDPRGGMPEQSDTAAWVRDPLAHPALGAMSQRELGDLPFDRRSCDCKLAQESCR